MSRRDDPPGGGCQIEDSPCWMIPLGVLQPALSFTLRQTPVGSFLLILMGNSQL